MEDHRPKKLLDKSAPVLLALNAVEGSLAKECHPPQTLFLSHGAGLRRLHQALHLLPRRASPIRNGVLSSPKDGRS
jgi:hypothetical protein